MKHIEGPDLEQPCVPLNVNVLVLSVLTCKCAGSICFDLSLLS